MLACRWLFRDSRGIQTHNLLIRSQMLYSVELGSLISFKRVQRYGLFMERPNILPTFLEKFAIMHFFTLFLMVFTPKYRTFAIC